MSEELSPDRIRDLALMFAISKTLLSAVELGLFTELAKGPLDCETLRQRLGIHRRSARDFFDALVALNLLDRQSGHYRNTPETDYFLDRNKPSYVGGTLEMINQRLYRFWGSLTEGLRTGLPQNEAKGGSDAFTTLYADPQRLRLFLEAMVGLARPVASMIARKFPWERYRTFIDVGGAQGVFAVEVALAHVHLSGGSFDLPPVKPMFQEYVESFGLSARLRFYPGDFSSDPLPGADVLVMGHVLHDWNMDEKRLLLAKAYQALLEGGALIVYENLIDDERRRNVSGLMMSLNMLIETRGGFDFTGADCCRWMREAGFRHTSVEPLTSAEAMVVAIK